MDEVVAYVRDEVMPVVEGMSGCVGVSMLAARDSGRAIITTAWADEGAMRATEQSVRDSRDRATEMMGGEHSVQEWEIALLHRAHGGHDGACSRVVWGELDPATTDDALSTFRMTTLPRIEELPGFCSVSMMVDRSTGRCAVATTYDSRDDMTRAADAARGIREEGSRETGMRLTDVAEFDLAIHHLRVPETV